MAILGHICVQWAKKRGCHVIGTTSSPEKAEALKKLGCDRVINYKTEDLSEVLSKEYPVRYHKKAKVVYKYNECCQ